MVTLGPARHLGIDADFGSIEPGKVADLVAFHPREGYADVTHAWVAGELRFSAPERTARAVPA